MCFKSKSHTFLIILYCRYFTPVLIVDSCAIMMIERERDGERYEGNGPSRSGTRGIVAHGWRLKPMGHEGVPLWLLLLNDKRVCSQETSPQSKVLKSIVLVSEIQVLYW